MAYPSSEIIILNDDELYLLLIAAGVEGLYGPGLRSEEDGPMDLESFNRALASLYQKGFVDWAGDKIRISEEIKEILKVIRASSVCISIKPDSGQESAIACYADNGKVVVLDGRAGMNGEIELSMLDTEDWINSLERSGYFPETAGIPSVDEEEPSATEEFISELELRDSRDGGLIQSVTLYEKGLFGLISLRKDKSSERMYFSRKRIDEILKGWIGGGQ